MLGIQDYPIACGNLSVTLSPGSKAHSLVVSVRFGSSLACKAQGDVRVIDAWILELDPTMFLQEDYDDLDGFAEPKTF